MRTKIGAAVELLRDIRGEERRPSKDRRFSKDADTSVLADGRKSVAAAAGHDLLVAVFRTQCVYILSETLPRAFTSRSLVDLIKRDSGRSSLLGRRAAVPQGIGPQECASRPV